MTLASRASQFAHWRLIALLAFTLALRGGLILARFDQLQADPDSYLLIAQHLVRSAVFSVDDPSVNSPRPSAYRPPLYPVLLSNLAVGKDLIIHSGAIAIAHLAMGLATVWLTWLIARWLELGWASYIAGLLVACDPILLNQQSLIMTETLAALCTVIAWALLVRFHFNRNWWNAGLAGGAIGLAALCRPTYLPWLAVSVLLSLLLKPGKVGASQSTSQQPNREISQRLLNAIAMLIGGVSVLSPWVIRNYQAFQEPLVTTTHGGYTLYLANNRHFFAYLRHDQTGLPWDPKNRTEFGDQLRYRESFNEELNGVLYGLNAPVLSLVGNNEFEYDRMLAEQSRQEIRNDPAGFLLAAWYRVRQLWSPLPYKLAADESRARMLLRYLTAGWYLTVYALALAGCYRLRWNLLRSPWLWGVLLCAIFTGVHTLYWCNLRMRAPLMPIVAIVAAAGLLQVTQSAGRVRSSA
ncbi:ArnT family glycosyltransferase [Anatilimnocola aggregata]|uniref:ArnT family glycosyltransferase n=1 Tax=Anatilimnocola aggregata TaxID=2528021 RepID=UPI00192E4712|nr:glycosyltransferase family 39 protein [Anatilimnocola aggregata]